MLDNNSYNVFIEQAEYLNQEQLSQWYAEHPDEERILKKLCQGGAKLISGPRGAGKTTLMRKAMHIMQSRADLPHPIYVNYKRSLAIEPIYKNGNDGTYWFNQWLLLKVYVGIYESMPNEMEMHGLSITKTQAENAASLLEMSNAAGVNTPVISISTLAADLSKLMAFVGRSKCVLLLDDAAHAFSVDQQGDFFDFFRQIKSHEVSPKAAVYPGVTGYSHSFHVGHDAELVDIWVKPDGEKYLDFMRGLIKSRFPDLDFSHGDIGDLLDLIIYAAFGIPRAMLNMIQSLSVEEDGSLGGSFRFSRSDVLRSIKQHYSESKKLFSTLGAKLPVYKNFIEAGEGVIDSAIDIIKAYNKAKPIDKQSVSIAVDESGISPELRKVFEFFQYSGLCIQKEELISRGVKGRFRIFVINYSGLIGGNALVGAKSINIKDYNFAFSSRNAHEFTRTNQGALLVKSRSDSPFEMSLPPCIVCKSPRVSELAKFCINCGSVLTVPSAYISLMNSDISSLPLTAKRISKIKAQSDIKFIKDIIMDSEHRKLLSIERIGPFWAEKISRLAKEFLE